MPEVWERLSFNISELNARDTMETMGMVDWEGATGISALSPIPAMENYAVERSSCSTPEQPDLESVGVLQDQDGTSDDQREGSGGSETESGVEDGSDADQNNNLDTATDNNLISNANNVENVGSEGTGSKEPATSEALPSSSNKSIDPVVDPSPSTSSVDSHCSPVGGTPTECDSTSISRDKFPLVDLTGGEPAEATSSIQAAPPMQLAVGQVAGVTYISPSIPGSFNRPANIDATTVSGTTTQSRMSAKSRTGIRSTTFRSIMPRGSGIEGTASVKAASAGKGSKHSRRSTFNPVFNPPPRAVFNPPQTSAFSSPPIRASSMYSTSCSSRIQRLLSMQPLAAWRVPTNDFSSPDTSDKPLAWGIQFLPEFVSSIANVEMMNLFLASLEGPIPSQTRGWAQGSGLYIEELHESMAGLGRMQMVVSRFEQYPMCFRKPCSGFTMRHG